jgi:hypothetical protein
MPHIEPVLHVGYGYVFRVAQSGGVRLRDET